MKKLQTWDYWGPRDRGREDFLTLLDWREFTRLSVTSVLNSMNIEGKLTSDDNLQTIHLRNPVECANKPVSAPVVTRLAIGDSVVQMTSTRCVHRKHTKSFVPGSTSVLLPFCVVVPGLPSHLRANNYSSNFRKALQIHQRFTFNSCKGIF